VAAVVTVQNGAARTVADDHDDLVFEQYGQPEDLDLEDRRPRQAG
jgi:hypothetical protein